MGGGPAEVKIPGLAAPPAAAVPDLRITLDTGSGSITRSAAEVVADLGAERKADGEAPQGEQLRVFLGDVTSCAV